MSELPAMPFFAAEFFADTGHLSGEERGAYLILLGHAWLRGAKLPDDDLALSRLAGVSARKWAALKTAVLAFWEKGPDGFIRQKRLTKEFDFVCSRREMNRQKGSLGGKASPTKFQAKSIEAAEPDTKQPTPTPTPTLKEKDTSICPADNLDAPLPSKDLFGALPRSTNRKKAEDENAEIVAFADAWNELAIQTRLPQVEVLEPRIPKIRKAMKFLAETTGDWRSGFRDVEAKIRGSPYLLGEVNGFRCTFDFVINMKNLLKILEGNFDASDKRQKAANGNGYGAYR